MWSNFEQERPGGGNYCCARMMQSASQRDGELPAAIAAIDWSAALAAHGRWLRTVVIARLGEPQAADEVMQELSLAVIKQSAPLADASKLAPWLYRLAVRQALLYRRARGRQRKLAGSYADHVRPGEYEHDPTIRWRGCWRTSGACWCGRRSLGFRRATRRYCCSSTRRTGVIATWQITWASAIRAVEARLHRARGRLRRELAAFEVFEVQ